MVLWRNSANRRFLSQVLRRLFGPRTAAWISPLVGRHGR